MHHNPNSPKLSRVGSGKSIIDFMARHDSAQVRLIWQNDRICEYLLASDSRRHTWHAWLAVHGTVRDAAEMYRFLTFAKSREILKDTFGNCPPGIVSALGKFGPFARPQRTYFSLHQVLSAGGSLANHVHQSSKIEDDELMAFASAVHLPVPNRVIRALLKCKMPAQVLLELLWVISRLTLTYGEQQMVQCVAQGRQPGSILANVFSLAPFPKPPFEQLGSFIPITTAEQLRDAGKEFNNCLKGGEELAFALASVQSGRRYFYRWDGCPPTLLAFCRCGPAGWVLSERAGPANARVPSVTINQISEVLAGVPYVFIGNGGGGMLEWICAR
ncbi:hypothetical protein [Mesorhizobium sp. B2-3-5]|uniref:hypothetical protein n=1 Tax=Mesorhizobium sp. B2-3-5 TaxID=2589958 RepID=UPI00112BDD59|nr:hypothetical protein [Mesorhizobium sp. B2-3-5]TPM21720.1 hypothetical protein FJ958_25430 [Mesorhizobium sp. B2-3-5]